MAAPRKTRDRILDAALALFLERGVAGTTVSDIERAVGLAAGTGSFYRHFPSKEAVVVPAFEQGLHAIAAEIEGERVRTADVEDPRERTLEDLRSMLGDMRRVQPFWTLLMMERAQYPELERVFVDTLAMDSWNLEPGDPMRAILIAALTGYHQLSLLSGSPYSRFDSEEFVSALVDLIEHALAPDRP